MTRQTKEGVVSMQLKNSLVAAALVANVAFAAGTLSAADWYIAPGGTVSAT